MLFSCLGCGKPFEVDDLFVTASPPPIRCKDCAAPELSERQAARVVAEICWRDERGWTRTEENAS